ncbi:hypothetical protein [Ktedonospora formicarum]|uniref:Lipoprotein n=1 Tax=Ktedonospora formicarum TaxID=2778364 RepID=A0A8J3I1N6_9CHLR|nr:hypothetical protein [Ktedonospora formicarum]GHO45961.1 hypothetical protein KSX_41240 [Ktedonospora formicarum]
MRKQQHKQAFIIFFLAAFICVLLLVGCDMPSARAKQQSPEQSNMSTLASTAQIAPLPNITPQAGWKLAYETSNDATNLRKGESQKLAPIDIPPGTGFHVVALCAGDGSIEATLEGSGEEGATTNVHASMTCTPSSSPTPKGTTVMADGITQATLSVTLTGPIQWKVVVEEPE